MIRYLFCFLLLLPGWRTLGQGGSLIVNIERVQVAKGGELSVGIFVRENFPSEGKQLVGTVKAVSGPNAQVIFQHIPAGDYGVVAFQDIDQNKRLKTNLVGFPTEPIGFSNGAKIRLGPPRFDDARVSIRQGETLTLTIVLQ